MAWPLNQQDKDAFIQFLEPNPPLNNHQGLKIKHFSFYSSELKSLGQVLRTLLNLSGGGVQGAVGNDARYRNTLFNLGLIVENNGTFVTSTLGAQVLSYCQQNNINIQTFADGNQRAESVEIETQILNYLINELLNGDPSNICTDNFKQVLYNVQEVYNSIPVLERPNVTANEFRCYFFQLINVTGNEIKRFYRLSIANQTAFENLWTQTSDDANFPAAPPNGVIESMVYKYCKTRAKNVLQYDIRLRVQAFLTAYTNAIATFGNNMPILAPDLSLINNQNNINIMNQNNRSFDLGQVNQPAVTPIPRHRIISGCPGSGKSHYIDEQIQLLNNSYKIKTTFHQESTYYDFVGTYKPTPLYEVNAHIVDSSGQPFALGKPVINYSYVFGPLIEAYLFAVANPNHNVVLVIDEINRGNVGVIFGDFFQLLDRDPNSGYISKYSILPNADLLDFLKQFNFMQASLQAANNHINLPGNLFIWGTMNGADQGVFPLDSAFRRRWEFEYKGYNEPCHYGADVLKYNGNNITWDNFRNGINSFLLTQLNTPEDKLIGPYFLTQQELGDPNKVLNKLFLYLWDDVVRFQQKEIMDFNSFADLKNVWSGGNGKIFKFDI